VHARAAKRLTVCLCTAKGNVHKCAWERERERERNTESMYARVTNRATEDGVEE